VQGEVKVPKFLGFYTHKNIMLYIENDREVALFAQSVIDNRESPTDLKHAESIVADLQSQLHAAFSPSLKVHALDAETLGTPHEFGDLVIRIETEISKLTEH
jgi:hypothetical protein